MQSHRLVNVCLIIIVGLLAIIARRPNATAYAAKPVEYEVLHPDHYDAASIQKQVQKEAQSGWELVAAPFWALSGSVIPQGYLIFRRSE